MLSAVLLLDRSGDIIVMRKYRNNFDYIAIENYRTGVIADAAVVAPAVLVDDTSFLHHYAADIFYVAVTRQNVNACAIFEFLSRLPHIFAQVLGMEVVNSIEIKKFVPEVLELLDEMIDGGYLQNTDTEALRMLTSRQANPIAETPATVMATGAVSWRPTNIVYQQNTMRVTVVEKMSCLASATGIVGESSVNGTITLKSKLSGTPECTITFGAGNTAEGEGVRGIGVDDVVFHQCVKLNDLALSNESSSETPDNSGISFTPPDGEFELMRYRKTSGLGIPFAITPWIVEDTAANRVEIHVSCRAQYSDVKISASMLVLTIPLPHNTADVDISQSKGRGKFAPELNAVQWTCLNFAGGSQGDITVTVKCIESTSRITPAKTLTKPINVEFSIANFSSSGLTVGSVHISEKSGYAVQREVLYKTQSGKYEVRML